MSGLAQIRARRRLRYARVGAIPRRREWFLQRMQPLRSSLRVLLWICGSATGFCHAQNLLPNPMFEEGLEQPTGWRLVGGEGRRLTNVNAKGSVLMVRGTGRDQTLWRTEPLALKSDSLYRLSFVGRCERSAAGGAAIAGSSTINRDFELTESWTRYGFVFRGPAGDPKEFIRLGQWHVTGSVFFAQAALSPVVATFRRIAPDVELGEGESIQDGIYRFKPSFNWSGANSHRPLLLNRATFNTDRWVFSSGSEIIYRLGLKGGSQVEGKVHASINFHTAGSLLVQASRDGANWLPLATCDGQRRGASLDLPVELFPADEIFVRLSCQGTDANLQVNSFEYESRLDRKSTRLNSSHVKISYA